MWNLKTLTQRYMIAQRRAEAGEMVRRHKLPVTREMMGQCRYGKCLKLTTLGVYLKSAESKPYKFSLGGKIFNCL